MSEMLERVCAAMKAVRYLTVAAEMNAQLLARLAETPEDGWSGARIEHGLAVQSEWYLRMARAAIAATREPTHDMLIAGLQAWEREPVPGEDSSDLSPNWRAMIDAALK